MYSPLNLKGAPFGRTVQRAGLQPGTRCTEMRDAPPSLDVVSLQQLIHPLRCSVLPGLEIRTESSQVRSKPDRDIFLMVVKLNIVKSLESSQQAAHTFIMTMFPLFGGV